MSNLYRGPSIDASYQVSVHLVKWFQRRRFLEINQSEKKWLVVSMFVIGLEPLKPLDQMNRKLVGSIIGRSSIKFPHLFPIR
jgi:hypothetical protein